MVDRKDDIHFVREVTGHILQHKMHCNLCYSKYYTKAGGICSTPFVNPFSPWVSADVIFTLHDGLMQPYFTKNNFSLLEQVIWTPSTEDVVPYHLSKQATKVTKQSQNTPLKGENYVFQDGVDNLPPPKWLKDDIIDFLLSYLFRGTKCYNTEFGFVNTSMLKNVSVHKFERRLSKQFANFFNKSLIFVPFNIGGNHLILTCETNDAVVVRYQE